jgi:ubiquinone/menaquinone biosynthesis C-methylase UbiE
VSGAGYTVLPVVYDRWQEYYGEDFSCQILPRLLSTLKRFPVSHRTMVDVACGTGTLGLEMHARGWHVIGIDASAGMITEARRKCPARAEHITFVHADMREFTLTSHVHLATSFFDSINHLLTQRDLLKTFRTVAANLEPGGLFVFDVSNELCYRTLWMQTETIRHKEFTLVLRNRYRPRTKTAVSHVTLFRRVGNRTRRSVESVRERCYSSEQVYEALRSAGFTVLQAEDFSFTNNPAAGKLKTWWVARRVSAGTGKDASGE